MWRHLLRTSSRIRIYGVLHIPRRFTSTSSIDPSIQGFSQTLATKQPFFQVPASTVRVLTQPTEFYRTLLDMICRAEERIFLSSLYIGAEESELISALQKRLRERPGLKLTLLLDLNRSTRPGPDSTARVLLPLLEEFGTRVRISMFRSPSLRGFLARIMPPRFNEGWGTWHAKIYGGDNNVMISGANLNKSYFTNRQDRYIHFEGHTSLAQYCFDFIETAMQFSYALYPQADAQLASNPYSRTQEGYVLYWPIPTTHPHHFNSVAEAAFSSLQKSYRGVFQKGTQDVQVLSTGHALLFPIIQAGQFKIREEEWVFQRLFYHLTRRQAPKRRLLDLTSGYFSLYQPYQDLLLDSPDVDCRVVAASPKANGFYGSKGISGRIPEGYTLFEQRFMRAVAKAGRLWRRTTTDGLGQGLRLSEWEKPGWTYHAKGIWLSPDSSTPPILTLFGSTNLNSRSAHIDTELSFLMIIPSEEQLPSTAESRHTDALPQLDQGPALLSLRQDLAREIDGIRADAVDWKGAQRKVRWTTKMFVWLLKGML